MLGTTVVSLGTFGFDTTAPASRGTTGYTIMSTASLGTTIFGTNDEGSVNDDS